MTTEESIIKKKDSLKEYHRNWQKKRQYDKEWNKNKYIKNKESIKQRSKDWYKNNPDIVKNTKLKRSFGITLDQYNEMLKKQNGLCGICFLEERKTDARSGKTLMLSVDHSHINGSIRGLLCSNCNLMLGRIKDDIQILKNAIKYLGE